jgi:hypothetical protein
MCDFTLLLRVKRGWVQMERNLFIKLKWITIEYFVGY